MTFEVPSASYSMKNRQCHPHTVKSSRYSMASAQFNQPKGMVKTMKLFLVSIFCSFLQVLRLRKVLSTVGIGCVQKSHF